MRVTKRELLFSVIIVVILLTIGFFISFKITERDMEKQEAYTKALRVTESDTFEYAFNTKVGNLLAYGDGIADTPVVLSDLIGEYSVVQIVKYRYTEHVNYVTKTDSNGNSYTERQVTYSWDRVGSKDFTTDTVSFMGKTININAFHFDGGVRLNLTDVMADSYKNKISGNHYYENGRFSSYVGAVRWDYYGIPKNFKGTLFVNSQDTINVSKTMFYLNMPIDMVLKSLSKNMTTHQVVFWVCWSLFIIASVILFVYFDNHWLEDKIHYFRINRRKSEYY